MFQYKFGLLKFILHFSLSIAIASSRNCFPLLKAGLNDHSKYCFLVVTIVTLALFMGFSIDLPNVASFLVSHFVFWFCYLLFLLLFANLYCIRYIVLKMVLLWIIIFYEFFLIAALNKISGFDSGVCIFFDCLDWE